MYKLTQDSYTVQRLSDGAYIPVSAADNRDAAEYAKWVAGGNTPSPSLSAPEEALEAFAEVSAWAKAKREGAIASTVLFNGTNFDCDRVSIQNLLGIVVAVSAGIPLPAGFVWRSADNVNVPMTVPNLIALGGLMLGNVNAAYAKAWAIKDNFRKTNPKQTADKLVW